MVVIDKSVKGFNGGTKFECLARVEVGRRFGWFSREFEPLLTKVALIGAATRRDVQDIRRTKRVFVFVVS